MNRSNAICVMMLSALSLGWIVACDGNSESGNNTNVNSPENSQINTVKWADQTYRTVRIGTQRWMAENLNYKGTGTDTIGTCYKDSPDSCTKYGRLYTWNEVMNGAEASAKNPSGVQGICPTGWHIPSHREWTILTTFIGDSTAGRKLKSKTGWLSANGTDDYGFSALPGGYSFWLDYEAGTTATFWSTSMSTLTGVWTRFIYDSDSTVASYGEGKGYEISLRCLEN